jgi:hypothetical protein
MKWRLINIPYGKPMERFSHTMVPFENKLVVFGGAGSYVKTIKMRLSFNDI